MAHHKSAEKRIRQTAVRTERNKALRTRMKNVVKNVRIAAESGDAAALQEAFRVANKELHRLVSKGLIKKQTASRKVSRLAKLLNAQ
ncbi:MAG: 30S ribosomal protein S20 [Campylobacterales bacterium]